jgi:hypothetical protein
MTGIAPNSAGDANAVAVMEHARRGIKSRHLPTMAKAAGELIALAIRERREVEISGGDSLGKTLMWAARQIANEDAQTNVNGNREYIETVVDTGKAAAAILPHSNPDKFQALSVLLKDASLLPPGEKRDDLVRKLASDCPYPPLQIRAKALLKEWGVDPPVSMQRELTPRAKHHNRLPRSQRPMRHADANGPEYLRRHEVPGFLQTMANLENLLKQELQHAFEGSPHYDLYQRAERLAESLEDIPALSQAANEITERLVAREMEPIWGMLDVANALARKADSPLDGVRLYTAIAVRAADDRHMEFRAAVGMLLNADRLPQVEREMVLRVIADDCAFEGARGEARDMLQGNARPPVPFSRRDI